jgi:hypothetical protein
MGWKIYIYGAIGSMVGDIKKDARGCGEGHQAHQEEVSSNYCWAVLTFFENHWFWFFMLLTRSVLDFF